MINPHREPGHVCPEPKKEEAIVKKDTFPWGALVIAIGSCEALIYGCQPPGKPGLFGWDWSPTTFIAIACVNVALFGIARVAMWSLRNPA